MTKVKASGHTESIESAWSAIDRDHLKSLLASMTDIPSPTGHERELAEFLVATMQAEGLEGRYQPIDGDQGNALGSRAGDGSGVDLLLYAPIDTHIAGDPDADGPWVGEFRPDLRPRAVVDGDVVIGLGAENPKAFAACVLAAAVAIQRAGVTLAGSLRVGLCAGGMPTNAPPGSAQRNIGHGVGCSYMLEQGFDADYAIIAKPGWAVSHEEVGVCWLRVTTHGRFNYTGIRHFRTYRNPIVDMAVVIEELEKWFPRYSAANESGLVYPQGAIGAIEAGWPWKPAFNPEHCDLYVDLRCSPRVEPIAAKRQLDKLLHDVVHRHEGIQVTSELILAIPGTSTPVDSWIVTATIAGWEAVTGRPHEAPRRQSGATDANILRARGLPTARIGMPPVRDLPYADDFSMGVAHVDAMVDLTRVLVHAAIATCARKRDAATGEQST